MRICKSRLCERSRTLASASALSAAFFVLLLGVDASIGFVPDRAEAAGLGAHAGVGGGLGGLGGLGGGLGAGLT